MNCKTIARWLSTSVTLFACAVSAAGTGVFKDDFSNEKSGWPNSGPTSTSELGFAIYADGDYQLTPVADGVFGYVPAPKQAGSGDVSIAADMYLLAAVGRGMAGLACRVTDAENFYGFIARGDAVMMIVKVSHGEVTPLATGRVRSVLPGSVDTRFKVSCKGNQLRFSAEDGETLTASDSQMSMGTSGLVILGEKAAGTMATFDNFELSALQP